MKVYISILFLSIILSGCAQHSAYDTARFRRQEFKSDKITLTKGGLTTAQIRSISSTKAPSEFPVDLSVIFIKDRYITNEMERVFLSRSFEPLKASPHIDRIVPIPKYLLPENVTFPIIQELGIRTLTEYVLVFIVNEASFFRHTKIVDTQFKITSSVDFIIVDSHTTAILASDRLFSQIIYNDNLFKAGEKEKAQTEIFSEQGKLLGEKLAKLFSKKN